MQEVFPSDKLIVDEWKITITAIQISNFRKSDLHNILEHSVNLHPVEQQM